MRQMGIEALYRKPRTSIPAREATITVLLENLVIDRPIRCGPRIDLLPMAHGFMYLMAILDVASRKVLAWRLSNTLTAHFCVEALEEAMRKFGRPEISIPIKDRNHERGSDHAAEGRRRCDQHGWQGTLDRQRLYRTVVAERKVRGSLSAGVCERD